MINKRIYRPSAPWETHSPLPSFPFQYLQDPKPTYSIRWSAHCAESPTSRRSCKTTDAFISTLSAWVFPAGRELPSDDLTDLGRIKDDGDDGHSAATDGTGPYIDLAHLGQKGGPCATPCCLPYLPILGYNRSGA